MNWNLPILSSLYTDFLTLLKSRDTDLAKGMDPALVTVTNPETGFLRWNSANKYWEKFGGVSYAPLETLYNITVATANAVPAAAITSAMLRNSVGVSVIGRSANSTGVPADIVAGADDRVLARTGSALSFAQLTVGMAPNSLWTYAKIQNVSATDKLLGRSTAGAGVIEEIACTSVARTLIAQTTQALMRTTGLGLGTLATLSSVSTTELANDAVTYAKMQNVSATNKILGRSTSGAGDVEEITCTAAGRALLDDADAAAQRTTLGIVSPSLVLLDSKTASGSSVLDFTTGIDSTYDEYELHFVEMVPAANGARTSIRVSTDGGSSYKSGVSDYRYASTSINGAATAGTFCNTDSMLQIVGGANGQRGGTTGMNGVIKFYAPSTTIASKCFVGKTVCEEATTTDVLLTEFGGRYQGSSTAINAIRVLMSTGNITSGSVYLYGVKKA